MTNRIEKSEANEHNDRVAEMFKDLPPFTIVVNDGYDAAFISSAMLGWFAGDEELGHRSLETMCVAALSLGVEQGVSLFFDEAAKQGHRFPKCMKPIFIHMVGHVMRKYIDPDKR